MEQMDIEIIKRYLPHRYPFLLVDRVLAVEPGKSLSAIKNVTVNEPFFNGHFPIRSVMPGVLIVEALAQASGILIYKTLNCFPSDELFYLAGIDNARFKRVVVPGDQLHLQVEISKQRLNLWKFLGQATVNGELACAVEFMNMRDSNEH